MRYKVFWKSCVKKKKIETLLAKFWRVTRELWCEWLYNIR
jgi:hypothetical protein